MTALDLSGPIPSGSVLLEASAGTGKPFALTTLIARSLAEGPRQDQRSHGGPPAGRRTTRALDQPTGGRVRDGTS